MQGRTVSVHFQKRWEREREKERESEREREVEGDFGITDVHTSTGTISKVANTPGSTDM